MKRYKILSVVLGIGIMISGCGGGAQGTTEPASVAPATVAAATVAEEIEAAAITGGSAESVEFRAEGPVVITSAGQSADFEMMKVMFDQNEIAYTADSVVTEDALNDCKTLVVAVGGSAKGLGAAGIDADMEQERVKKLLDVAEEKGITIIAAHIGGSGRRGQLGDRYIEPVVAKADYIIVVESGNNDGLFTKLAEQYSTPLTSAVNMTDIVPIIGAIFQ